MAFSENNVKIAERCFFDYSYIGVDTGRFMAVDRENNQRVDLDRNRILADFAKSQNSERMVALLMRIDDADKWTVDFKQEESENPFDIVAFIHHLQFFLNNSGLEALNAAPREFLELLGGLRSSRCLYLLKVIGEHAPGLAETLEKHLFEINEPASESDRLILVVRRRVEAFTKAQLLGEIFSNERLERVKSLMGTIHAKQ